MVFPVSALVRVRRGWGNGGVEVLFVLSSEVEAAVVIIILLS